MKPLVSAYTIAFVLLLVIWTACLPGTACGQMPNNLGFESGNFTNWTCWIGQAAAGTPTTGTVIANPQVSAPIGGNPPCTGPNQSRHYITDSSSINPCYGLPQVCPAGGSHSLRLGNNEVGGRAEKVRYYLQVPANAPSYNISIQYAVVLENADQADKAPTFKVLAYDSATEAVLPRSNSLYINPFISTHLTKTMIATFSGWTASTINLKGMSGKTVLLEVSVTSCANTGHFGYAHFDVVGVSDTLQAGLVSYNANCDSAVLQGPPGYKSYQWFNQNFSVAFNAPGDTSPLKTLPVPAVAQYYNLILSPYAANGISDTIQSQVLQPCSLNASNTTRPAASIYPNPTTNVLHVDFGGRYEGTLRVRNVLGQSIFEHSLANLPRYDLVTADFPAGIYSLVLTGRYGSQRTIKFVVNR